MQKKNDDDTIMMSPDLQTPIVGNDKSHLSVLNHLLLAWYSVVSDGDRNRMDTNAKRTDNIEWLYGVSEAAEMNSLENIGSGL